MQGGLATMADEDQDSRRNDVLPSANGEGWPMHHEGGADVTTAEIRGLQAKLRERVAAIPLFVFDPIGQYFLEKDS